MGNGTSRKYQDAGFGLALTRSMVDLHSSAICPESGGAGKGNTSRLAILLQDALEASRSAAYAKIMQFKVDLSCELIKEIFVVP